MYYDKNTNTIAGERPEMVTRGRHNVWDPSLVVHHRIPWSMLKNNVLNKVLAGTLEPRIIKSLLRLSPCNRDRLVDGLKVALHAIRRQKVDAKDAVAIEEIARELYSIPCNVFVGRDRRADDPEDELDFTPSDVQYNGELATGIAGQIQDLRERLFGQLSKEKIDVDAVDLTCRELARKWAASYGGLSSGTPNSPEWWTPVRPGSYRRWRHPILDIELDIGAVKALNARITGRARKKGYRVY